MPKNTAPAIGLGCAAMVAEDPQAVVAVLPSDHLIRNDGHFRELLTAAGTLALEKPEKLVTLGIVPDYPATGYGYIERGLSLGRFAGQEVFQARRFVEKPDAARAATFLASGTYLWNSGMFVFRAATLLEEIRKRMPELGQDLDRYSRQPVKSRDESMAFAHADSISIDYAIMEKSPEVAVFPADIGWDDVGSFRSLAGVNPDGKGGSSTLPEPVLIDSPRNLIHAPGKTVALIGVEDLVVVEEEGCLLIARRDRAEDVKKVVDELSRRKRDDVL